MPGVTLEQLEAAVEAVVRDVQSKPVEAAHVARAKTRLVADAIYAQDNQASLARWYGAALTTGSSVADVQAWPDRIDAVDAAAMQAAARRWLERRRAVSGFLLPAEVLPPEAEAKAAA